MFMAALCAVAVLTASGGASISGTNLNISNRPFDNQADTSVALSGNNTMMVASTSDSPNVNPLAWLVKFDAQDDLSRTARTLPSLTKFQGGAVQNVELGHYPSVAADAAGTFWYAAEANANDGSGAVINRLNADQGEFQPTNVAIPKDSMSVGDRPNIAVDSWGSSTKRGTLYAVWVNDSLVAGTTIAMSQCDFRPGDQTSAVPSLCDNPAAWSSPSRVGLSGGTLLWSPSVTTAPDGGVYVVWQDATLNPYRNEIRIAHCPVSQPCTQANQWDGGVVHELHGSSGSGPSGLPLHCPIVAAPSPGVNVATSVETDGGLNGSERVYVAFSDLRDNGTTQCTHDAATDRTFDVFVARGTSNLDLGFTEERLTDGIDGANDTNDHFLPALAVQPTPSGHVHASFYSTFGDDDRQEAKLYYVKSNDQGATFPGAKAIADEPSNFSGDNSTNRDYGEYHGIDAVGTAIPHAAWIDNRSPDEELDPLLSANGEVYMKEAGSLTAPSDLDQTFDLAIDLDSENPSPPPASGRHLFLTCRGVLDHTLTGGPDTIATRLFCMPDGYDPFLDEFLTVNPEAAGGAAGALVTCASENFTPQNPRQCGDGLAGAPPPGVWTQAAVASGDTPLTGLFGNVNRARSAWSGSGNSYEPGSDPEGAGRDLQLEGCFETAVPSYPNLQLQIRLNPASGSGKANWSSSGSPSGECSPGGPLLGGSRPVQMTTLAYEAGIEPRYRHDSDGDGCSDFIELGSQSPNSGGKRDPYNSWDFYDVPTGTGLTRDHSVSGADTAAIVQRFGSNDATSGAFDRYSGASTRPNAPVMPPGTRANYHPAFDTGGPMLPGGNLWNFKPPDGSISGGDISRSVFQFGHNCQEH